MIALREHPEGVLLPVKAQPNARKNAILGEQAERLKVAVTAPPEAGKANEAITELLREWLGLRRAEIELVQGATAREKLFLIRGWQIESLRLKLAE